MFTKALRTKPQRTSMSLTKFHRAIPPRARTRTRLIERSATNSSLVLRIHYQLPLGVPFLIQPMQRKFVHSKLTQPTVNQLVSHLFPINGPSKLAKLGLNTQCVQNLRRKLPTTRAISKKKCLSKFQSSLQNAPKTQCIRKNFTQMCPNKKPPKTNSFPAESTYVTCWRLEDE